MPGGKAGVLWVRLEGVGIVGVDEVAEGAIAGY